MSCPYRPAYVFAMCSAKGVRLSKNPPFELIRASFDQHIDYLVAPSESAHKSPAIAARLVVVPGSLCLFGHIGPADDPKGGTCGGKIEPF